MLQVAVDLLLGASRVAAVLALRRQEEFNRPNVIIFDKLDQPRFRDIDGFLAFLGDDLDQLGIEVSPVPKRFAVDPEVGRDLQQHSASTFDRRAKLIDVDGDVGHFFRLFH